MSATRPQPRRERMRSSRPGEVGRAAVGRDDDLPAAVDQRVEGVEELFLGAVLAADELDVVDHQQVDRAEQLLEAHGVLRAQGAHELVHELLGREVDHAARRVDLADAPGDGVHQVGLAQAHAAIEEEGIEGRLVRDGHPLGRRHRELVGLADDEGLEGEAGIEAGAQIVQGRGLEHRRLRAGIALPGTGRATGSGWACARRGRCRCRGGHVQRYRADGGVDRGPDRPDAIGIVRHDPVAHELGRHGDHHPVAVALSEIQRLQPGRVSGVAQLGTQQAPHLTPLLHHVVRVRHDRSHLGSSERHCSLTVPPAVP